MRCWRIAGRRPREGGFTLAEVMVALAIVALTTVMLLSQRVDLIREARHTRDVRTAWVLAAQKTADLELDPRLWRGDGTSGGGDFGEMNPEFRDFNWEYAIVREEVPTNDPNEPSEKPKEIFRLVLVVGGPELEEPIRLEALFPIEQGMQPQDEAGGGGKPAEGEGKPGGGEEAPGEKPP